MTELDADTLDRLATHMARAFNAPPTVTTRDAFEAAIVQAERAREAASVAVVASVIRNVEQRLEERRKDLRPGAFVRVAVQGKASIDAGTVTPEILDAIVALYVEAGWTKTKANVRNLRAIDSAPFTTGTWEITVE